MKRENRADRARARPSHHAFRVRYLIGGATMIAGASFAAALPAPDKAMMRDSAPPDTCERADVSVMTYNVAGLPWPLVRNDANSLRAIGQRLAQLRAHGCAPKVVVLQEAFSRDAKQIGARAGYPFIVVGPYLRTGEWPGGNARANVMLGENAGTPVDSGLVILSDLPISDVQRAAFPQGACAGIDCLAAKGVLLITAMLPGGRKIMVAGTHFNSQRASRAPIERTLEAYRRQADFLARFIAVSRAPDIPVIVAGDFNRGQRPARTHLLQSAIERLAGGTLVDAFRTCMIDDPQVFARSADAQTIVKRARDMQFAIPARAARLTPTGAIIPFGTEADGSMLSDHIGYTVRYRYDVSPGRT